jgi:hypothetical protein
MDINWDTVVRPDASKAWEDTVWLVGPDDAT